MNASVLIGGASSSFDRRDSDFYPTPANVTQALVDSLKSENIMPSGWVWEPACGDGAMSRVLDAAGMTVVSSDIRSTEFRIGSVDYLETPAIGCGGIITNPPFKLAQKFIEKAVSEVPFVAILLKCDYWQAASRTRLFNENPPAYLLALNWRPAFAEAERGSSPTMSFLWTVWISGRLDTRYRILEKP